MKTTISLSLILFLSGVFALGPFATDSYLAAIPLMAGDLNLPTSSVALTVSIYVFAMAIGQLVGGPLCDRSGRRPTILLGLILFIAGGSIIAEAENLYTLYSGRVVQAIGGGIAVNRINAYLLNSYSPQKLLSALVGLQVLGLLILLISQLLIPGNWIFAALGFAIAIASLGGIIGNSNACFMSFFSKNTGVASSFIGASQSLSSAIIAALSTLLFSDSLLYLVIIMVALAAIAFFVSAYPGTEPDASYRHCSSD